MKTNTYTKINTLYKRYMNLGKVELPVKSWIKFQNKIMVGNYSDLIFAELMNHTWDCFCKIDGTNAKIVWFPKAQVMQIEGKTQNADIRGNGLEKHVGEIGDRIRPMLMEMFPPESARFTYVTDDRNQMLPYDEDGVAEDPIEPYDHNDGDLMNIKLQEKPVTIYGEYYGKKVGPGGNYDPNGNHFAVFDICIQGWYVLIGMLTEMCNNLGLNMAPYFGQRTLAEAETIVARGFKTMVPDAANKDYIEEGLVCRPTFPICDARGNRVIVKVKYKDYAELQSAIADVGLEEYDAFHEWYVANQDYIESIGIEGTAK